LTHRPVGIPPAVAKNSGSAAIVLGAIRSRACACQTVEGWLKRRAVNRGRRSATFDRPNIAGLCLSAIAPTGIQVRT